jgi:polyphosphate kinase
MGDTTAGSVPADAAEPAKKLKRAKYEKELYRLQVELCRVQRWVKAEGARVVVLFEGRDAAGKGGVIKRITELVSPRVFRVVALPAPTPREKSQLYIQRYMQHLPAGGEIVIFDRSWYNRAGVEHVMGFCTDAEYRDFLESCPRFEKTLVDSGIFLVKYWFEVGMKEQERRFSDRIADPTKQWKLSPMDVEAMRRWYDFSRARDAMFAATDTTWSPWHVVQADDKRRARLNCISHLLSMIPYRKLAADKVKLPRRQKAKGYEEPRHPYRWVPERY